MGFHLLWFVGLVGTSSLKRIGVLLVFSFLVISLLFVILFTVTMTKQISYGWLIGLVASGLGLNSQR
jgi:ABC-type Mn2+/Zn2+ transport system permease subunit